MTKYYFDGHRFGYYLAENDNRATEIRPKDCVIVYKESDTPNGRPFITVWMGTTPNNTS